MGRELGRRRRTSADSRRWTLQSDDVIFFGGLTTYHTSPLEATLQASATVGMEMDQSWQSRAFRSMSPHSFGMRST